MIGSIATWRPWNGWPATVTSWGRWCNRVAIGGGHDGPNPRNLLSFVNRMPQHAVCTVEGH